MSQYDGEPQRWRDAVQQSRKKHPEAYRILQYITIGLAALGTYNMLALSKEILDLNCNSTWIMNGTCPTPHIYTYPITAASCVALMFLCMRAMSLYDKQE